MNCQQRRVNETPEQEIEMWHRFRCKTERLTSDSTMLWLHAIMQPQPCASSSDLSVPQTKLAAGTQLEMRAGPAWILGAQETMIACDKGSLAVLVQQMAIECYREWWRHAFRSDPIIEEESLLISKNSRFAIFCKTRARPAVNQAVTTAHANNCTFNRTTGGTGEPCRRCQTQQKNEQLELRVATGCIIKLLNLMCEDLLYNHKLERTGPTRKSSTRAHCACKTPLWKWSEVQKKKVNFVNWLLSWLQRFNE